MDANSEKRETDALLRSGPTLSDRTFGHLKKALDLVEHKDTLGNLMSLQRDADKIKNPKERVQVKAYLTRYQNEMSTYHSRQAEQFVSTYHGLMADVL